MTWTIADGPPGIEVPHVWNTLFTLNDLSVKPHVKIDKITGGYSFADLDDDRDANTGRRGETPRPAYARGLTEVYECTLRAKTLQSMRNFGSQMRGAFRDRNNEGQMLLNGVDLDWFFNARVMDLQWDDEQFTGWTAVYPFQRKLTLSLRLSDARKYALPLFDDHAAGHASTTSAVYTNEGDTDTDPIFTVVVAGAGTQVTLENLSMATSNGTARLRFNGVPAGTMTVNFKARTATMADGTDVTNLMDIAYSQWWDELIEGMHSGNNNLKVTGGTWGVSFYHASE
jgi:hypothetical protein